MKKPSISFTLESEDTKKDIQNYAAAKGFNTASLARVAIMQYMNKNPLKSGKPLQRAPLKGIVE